MNLLEIGIVSGGICTLAVACFHTRFYIFFGWAEEFEKLTLLNRKILYTMHVFLILFFLPFAAISLLYSKELSSGDGLASAITLLYAIFWLIRAVWQAAYFRPSKLKVGAKMHLAHYLIITLSTAMFIVYIAPVAFRALA